MDVRRGLVGRKGRCQEWKEKREAGSENRQNALRVQKLVGEQI